MREAASAALASASSRLGPEDEQRARAVRPDAERPDHVARAPVDAGPAHARHRLRVLDAANGCQLALRRDEEANAGAADARLRARRLDLLAERGGERELVQVDAECFGAQLGVVTPAQARGELDQPRPSGPTRTCV